MAGGSIMRRCFLFHQRMHTWNLSFLVLGLSLPCLFSLSLAQAPPITPSGLNTQVSEPIAVGGQTQYDITGGTRPGGGANLFHSFGDFGVPSDNIANFQNTLVNGAFPHTDNILARVTGGDMSNIFGSIKTADFGSANLFLMNPAGFLFGPNATVNVGGMVAFTSADYLKLTGNARFNTIPNAAADTLLAAMPVASFGFLGSNPGAIIVQGSQFTAKSISLVGGNITIESGTPEGGAAHRAQFSAPNGNILLASARSPGEFDAATLQPLPNVNDTSFSSFGSVFLAPESSINLGGTSTVSIRGGQFVLSVNDAVLTTAESPSAPNTLSLNRGSSIVSSNSGANRGADIEVDAGTLQIDGAMIQNNTSGLGVGAGGNIFMNADSVTLQNGGALSTATSGTADSATGGTITVNAMQVELNAGTINASTGGPGDAGAVHINATDRIALTNMAIIASASENLLSDAQGNGGTITLHAPHIALSGEALVSSSTTGPGNAGDVVLEVQSLIMSGVGTQGGRVITNTQGPGQGGNITVRGLEGPASAAGVVQLTQGSKLFAQTIGGLTGAEENGGSIHVRAATLVLDGFSQLSTAAQDSAGEAGTVIVDATDSVRLSGGSSITSNSAGASFGQAGDIMITSPTIGLKGASFISTSTEFVRNAGNITLDTQGLSLTEGSQLTSNSGPQLLPEFSSGDAGSVKIQNQGSPAQSVLIDGANSGIFTNTEGTGAGGNITLDANTVTLQNGGTISAKTSGPITIAVGGSITVNATDKVIMSDGAVITANSTGPGNAGNIIIDAGQNFVATNGTVTTQTNQASGGDIKITTTPNGTVELTNSTISASVGDGPGGGGNISIDPQYVILQNSHILAQAAQGQGGTITITTNLFLPDANSSVKADSGSGLNGTVTIQSPNAPASGKIQPLGDQPLQATSLLNQHCAALAGGEFSSFTVTGRDSLPTEPGSWLASPLVAFGASDALGVTGEGVILGASLEGKTTLLSLRQIAPTGFLTQAFAAESSTGCS
ncbi:MAG: filamentous hemagglutinin N-terminal domain-containing protein [Nitrospira sp.]|nr:MAG: filamentous hemagglutinin N-terminal domain-containing protein [Nitrospira sp.]